MDALDKFSVLMNRHVIDERVFDARADSIPTCPIVLEPAQNHRVAHHDLNGIVVELLFADGDDVSDNVWVRIPTRSQRVGDNARSPAGGDEKKIMAKVLDRSVDVRRVSDRPEAARNFGIAARGISERGKTHQRIDENCRSQDYAENR